MKARARRRPAAVVRARTLRTRSAPGWVMVGCTPPIVPHPAHGRSSAPGHDEGPGENSLGPSPVVSRSWGVDVLGQGGLGGLDQRREGGGVVDGELGEHPPVDVHLGGLQALDGPGVGHAFGAGGGVDPLDPQLAEVALALAAVLVGVDPRVQGLLLRLAVQARALAAVAAGPLEYCPALLLRVDRAFYTCHGLLLNFTGPYFRPSILLTRSSSALATGTSLSRRAACCLDRSWNLWTLRARSRMTFPEPVTRKRFLAPECDFCFAIVVISLCYWSDS